MHDPSSPAPSFDSNPRLFEPLGAERASERLVGVWILGALALHAALGLAASGAEAGRRVLPPPSLVDVLVDQAEAPPVPEPPAAAMPESPAPGPRALAAAPAATPTPKAPPGLRDPEPALPATPIPAPPEAAPVLTSTDPAAFAVASASGTTVGGGVAPGGAGSGSSSGAAHPGGGTPRDLSRGAVPPDLRRLLFVNYPPSARMERAEGTATVRVTVHPDGRTSDLRVTSVRPGGRAFGETCSRTVLQGPKWKPALDVTGKAIGSTASYTCRFVLPEASAPTSSSRPTSGTGANRVWTRPAR